MRLRESLAEKQLEEVDRLYATAPVGLGFLDTELRVVRVNELLARMNGVSVEELGGKGNIGQASTAMRVSEAAISRFGSIDAVVANAGIFFTKPFTDYYAG